MGDIKKLFMTDENRETSGVWQDVGDGIRLKVARFNNTNHKRIMEGLMKPYQHQMRRGTLAEDVAEKLLVQGMAKAILIDWEGLEEDGKPVKYSHKNAERLMLEVKDFRDLVHNISQTMDIYKMQEDAETEKNSEPTSTGV